MQTRMMTMASVVLLHQLWKADSSVIKHLGDDADHMLAKVKAWDQGYEVYASLCHANLTSDVSAVALPLNDNMEAPGPSEASVPDLATNTIGPRVASSAEVPVLGEPQVKTSPADTPTAGIVVAKP